MSYTGASIRKIDRLAGSSLFRFRNGKQEMRSQNHCDSQSCSSTIELLLVLRLSWLSTGACSKQRLAAFRHLLSYCHIPRGTTTISKAYRELETPSRWRGSWRGRRKHLSYWKQAQTQVRKTTTVGQSSIRTQRSSAPVGQESGQVICQSTSGDDLEG